MTILEAMSWPLRPLGGLYALVMWGRNRAYDSGLLRSIDTGIKVLSIGNLSAGGTGKTPLTSLLLQEFARRGKNVAVVSRGYGGTSREPQRVVASLPDAAVVFGDEPTWLASEHPTVPVYVGADRVATVEIIKKDLVERIDCIVADDGFQHRRLKRQMDIVVIDATEPKWNYHSLPAGRLREGFGSLERAHAVVITKANLAEAGSYDELRARVGDRVPVFAADSRIVRLERLNNNGLSISGAELTGAHVLLASGIGRPSTFRKLVEIESRATIVDHMVFGDHHPYTKADLAQIEKRAADLSCSAIVVTEKDAVKMRDWNPKLPVWVTRLETRLSSKDLEDLYALCTRLIF